MNDDRHATCGASPVAEFTYTEGEILRDRDGVMRVPLTGPGGSEVTLAISPTVARILAGKLTETCRICGASEIVYHNYLGQPFCRPCSECSHRCKCGHHEDDHNRYGYCKQCDCGESTAHYPDECPAAAGGEHQPQACRWPGCLGEQQQAELADEVLRQDLGEPASPPGPDQRIICGCDEAPREGDAAERYDRALRTPPSPEACEHLRQRLADGTAARRTVRATAPEPAGDDLGVCTGGCDPTTGAFTHAADCPVQKAADRGEATVAAPEAGLADRMLVAQAEHERMEHQWDREQADSSLAQVRPGLVAFMFAAVQSELDRAGEELLDVLLRGQNVRWGLVAEIDRLRAECRRLESVGLAAFAERDTAEAAITRSGAGFRAALKAEWDSVAGGATKARHPETRHTLDGMAAGLDIALHLHDHHAGDGPAGEAS